MAKQKPEWFDQTKEFSSSTGIKIMAWGPSQLVVEAKSPEQARVIAIKLGQLGFKAVDDEGDAYAGMLTLTRGS